jgi:hypothetical protein
LPLVILSTLGADLMPPPVSAPAIHHPPPVPVTNIFIGWNLSTNWLKENTTLGGSAYAPDTNKFVLKTNSFATLDLSVLLTNLLTGLARVNADRAPAGIPAVTMPYAQSNGVAVPILGTSEGQFKSFYGPKSK